MSWRMFQNSATCVVVLIWLQMLSTVDYGLCLAPFLVVALVPSRGPTSRVEEA
jgi:hypothetical protein